ncbi:MAG: patatin-like phospholipase family protein [Flavobacteriales bacterium]|nr:patatin-like phospholipase family protein [Flavobacteriales bacterium]
MTFRDEDRSPAGLSWNRAELGPSAWLGARRPTGFEQWLRTFLRRSPVPIFVPWSKGLRSLGGGARGIAHLGLRAFAEAGITPSAISGTSAGALLGAFIACGLPSRGRPGPARRVAAPTHAMEALARGTAQPAPHR